jgi:hypothetical protein
MHVIVGLQGHPPGARSGREARRGCGGGRAVGDPEGVVPQEAFIVVFESIEIVEEAKVEGFRGIRNPDLSLPSGVIDGFQELHRI